MDCDRRWCIAHVVRGKGLSTTIIWSDCLQDFTFSSVTDQNSLANIGRWISGPRFGRLQFSTALQPASTLQKLTNRTRAMHLHLTIPHLGEIFIEEEQAANQAWNFCTQSLTKVLPLELGWPGGERCGGHNLAWTNYGGHLLGMLSCMLRRPCVY